MNQNYPYPPNDPYPLYNDVPGPGPGSPGKPHRRHGRHRARYGLIFFRALEILAVVLSYLEQYSIARFLTTKAVLNFVVDFTAMFGSDAGHRLSTFLAFLAAEPRLICLAVVLLVVIIELIVAVTRLFSPDRRRFRHR